MRFVPDQLAEQYDYNQQSGSRKQQETCMKAGRGSTMDALIQISVSWCGVALLTSTGRTVRNSGEVKEEKC